MGDREKDPRPVFGLTLGDVAGVGPEVTVRALAEPRVFENCRPLVLGDVGAIRKAIRLLGLDLKVQTVSPGEEPTGRTGTIEVLPLSQLAEEDLVYGRPSLAGAEAAAVFIETGAKMAMSGKIRGVVTAPISKEALNKAGRHFPGHTELLAHLAGGAEVVMMLAGPKLRVVLVTIHVRLKDVPDLVTGEAILKTARITFNSLKKYFGLEKPRVAVAALNPHASEGGLFGEEEEAVIIPAINQARRLGIELSGPYSADTLFYRAAAGEFDAVICMYHDQGLIPLKLLHFKDGVNVTLGLPFIRHFGRPRHGLRPGRPGQSRPRQHAGRH